jgi:hypothetical protein
MEQIPFLERLKLAWRVLIDSQFASKLVEPETAPAPERVHASGLTLLSALQREGRFIDFLQQDVAGFSDEDIGAAARVVHGGCRKTLQHFFTIAPAASGSEGGPMSVPSGFDSQRIRLTGNVSGHPPFKGTLKHHGWIVTEIRMPAISEALDARVLAPAEVELS